MQSRTDGMWWGAAIEAPDPAALGRFYSQLLGWPIGHEERSTTVLDAPGGMSFLVFQQAEGYMPPVWPPLEGAERPMVHLDFQVGDLDDAVEEALSLGAVLATSQPRPKVRVLIDPVGHPFCLCRDDG